MYRTRRVRTRAYRSQSGMRSVFVLALLALGILIGVLGMRVSQPRMHPDTVPAASPEVSAPSPQAPPNAAPAPSRAPRSNRNG